MSFEILVNKSRTLGCIRARIRSTCAFISSIQHSRQLRVMRESPTNISSLIMRGGKRDGADVFGTNQISTFAALEPLPFQFFG